MSVEMIGDAMAPKDLRTHCPLCGRGFDGVARTEEHIFPRWLQSGYDLWNRRLNLANFIDKQYRSVKIDICQPCNNDTFGRLEARLAPILTATDAYTAAASVSDHDLAVWLGKIFWLLLRKSHAAPDHRTRGDVTPDTIIPQALLPGTVYLGLLERAFAMGQNMVARYADDPADPRAYGPPFSIYRVRIDTRDQAAEAFDFVDDPFVLGAAIRLGTLGLICVFDGGLHRDFRSRHFPHLETETHHPVQFGEAVARVLYDGTVLHDLARRFETFWNPALSSMVAVNGSPRRFDPYMAENHDTERLADYIGRMQSLDPAKVFDAGGGFSSTFDDPDGGFFRYPVTAEEIAAVRSDPRRTYIPRDVRWRTTPDGPES